MFWQMMNDSSNCHVPPGAAAAAAASTGPAAGTGPAAAAGTGPAAAGTGSDDGTEPAAAGHIRALLRSSARRAALSAEASLASSATPAQHWQAKHDSDRVYFFHDMTLYENVLYHQNGSTAAAVAHAATAVSLLDELASWDAAARTCPVQTAASFAVWYEAVEGYRKAAEAAQAEADETTLLHTEALDRWTGEVTKGWWGSSVGAAARHAARSPDAVPPGVEPHGLAAAIAAAAFRPGLQGCPCAVCGLIACQCCDFPASHMGSEGSSDVDMPRGCPSLDISIQQSWQ